MVLQLRAIAIVFFLFTEKDGGKSPRLLKGNRNKKMSTALMFLLLVSSLLRLVFRYVGIECFVIGTSMGWDG
jgi:hypothetical protein